MNSGCNSHLIGNGVCNDETNNAEGTYDGGDCCGTKVNTDHCLDCKCYKVMCSAGIVPHHMVGDGFCNDEANHLECNYDGGDCCGPCVVKQYCSDCECLGGEHTGNGVSSPSVGDGFCHDDNNIATCNYDGGDCCVIGANTVHCADCICHLQETCAAGAHPNIGDGFCNDETNNPDCNYDGGDCCLSIPNTDQCSQCECFTNGAITSHGYPQNYYNNLDLSWLIVAHTEHTFEINFISFETESW